MVVTRTIRNRFVGDEPARGFESHHLRHKKALAKASAFLNDVCLWQVMLLRSDVAAQ